MTEKSYLCVVYVENHMSSYDTNGNQHPICISEYDTSPNSFQNSKLNNKSMKIVAHILKLFTMVGWTHAMQTTCGTQIIIGCNHKL